MSGMDSVKQEFVRVVKDLKKIFEERVTAFGGWNARAAVRSLLRDNSIRTLVKLDRLVNLVREMVPRYWENRHDLITDAVDDYIMQAATKSTPRPGAFMEGDIEAAGVMLVEDLSLDWYECRGFAVLDGVLLSEQKLDLGDAIRLRRATRFEVRALLWESESEGFLDRQIQDATRAGPFDVFIVECRADPIDPGNPREIGVDKELEVLEKLEDAVRILRLFGGTAVGTTLMKAGCWVDTSFQFMTLTPHNELNPFRDWRRISLKGTEADVWNLPLLIDSKVTPTIQEVWRCLQGMSITAQCFQADYTRSLIRYVQSLNERYIEDHILDLALCLETLTKSNGELAGIRTAALAGTRRTIKAIMKDVNTLFGLRNILVHGGRLDEEWKEQKRKSECLQTLERVDRVIRASLILAPYAASAIDESKHGDKAFRNLIDEWIVDCREQDKSRSLFPSWCIEKIEAEYHGESSEESRVN